MGRTRSLGALALAALSLGMCQAAYAQCTIPHTLTNGQVADATEVMDDIQAVADCVDAAPAGSSNAIQTKDASGGFSGIGPLTNGQVVVGVTGSPPQAATLTAGSNVTITNGAGAITISATGGGGGGGGGLYDISMGVPTSFTTVNIGGNSSVITNGTKAITIQTGTSTPTSQTLYGVSIPAPTTTPYMVAVLALPNFAPVRFSGAAIGFRDSSTGKLVVLSVLNGSASGFPGYSFSNWGSATGFNPGSEPGVPRALNYGPTWYGIQDDGTTISFWVSQDGAHFNPLPFTQTKSGGFLASYDSIFLGLLNDAEGGSEGSANDNLSVTFLAYDPDGLNRQAGN